MSLFLLSCDSAFGTEIVAAFEGATHELEWLLEDVNEQLAEQGISIRAVQDETLRTGNLAKWRSVRRQLEEWDYQIARFQSGTHSDLPEIHPARYQASLSVQAVLELILALRRGDSQNSTVQLLNAEPAPSPTSTEKGNSQTGGLGWVDDAPPAPGSRYQFGPVGGTLAALANALNQNSRTLKRWNRRSYFFIRRIHSRRYEAWVDSKAKFEEMQSAVSPIARARDGTNRHERV